MKKFTILMPQPCPMDRKKMTPTLNGDFCKKCRTEVVDFSSKSEKEIETYFKNHSGEKICGRFKPDQIQIPKNSGNFFRRIAALIVLAISGGVNNQTLAGGCTFTTTDHNYYPFDVVREWIGPDLHPLPAPDLRQEQVRTEIQEPHKHEPFSPVTMVMGIEPLHSELLDAYTHQPIFKDHSMSVPHIEDVLETETEKITQPIEEPLPELSIFPNPTSGPLNIHFKLNVSSSVQIEILDLAGKKVKAILASNNHSEGLFQLQADLSDLPNGIYHCVLNSETQSVSRKLVLSK